MGIVAVGLLVVTVAGCARPDLSPVPSQAAAPFVCDGVPLAGAELTLGGPVEANRMVGTWGRADSMFTCSVVRKADVKGLILVSDEDLRGVSPTTGEQGQLALLALQGDAQPIHADAVGAGYVFGIEPSGAAAWVCHGRYIKVWLARVEVEGRSQRADAQALLVSMLPWACGDQKVPAQTVGK
jgi:hypothetical protein